MPRNAPRKTQPPRAPGDQAYGDRQEQIQAQEAVPLPQRRGQPPPTSDQPAPQDPPRRRPDIGTALAALQDRGAPQFTPLDRPTEYPDEPITAGLPMGPGPGPEAAGIRRRPGPISDVLMMLAEATGEDSYADLALAARSEGR